MNQTQEARIKGGLGNPPTPYYTNKVESKNNIVLKQHVSYKAYDLPKFVDHMKDLQEQKNKVQRSVISQGEYRSGEFKSYAIDQA